MRVEGPGLSAEGPRLRVEISGLRVSGFGFRVEGPGSRVEGPEFRVQGNKPGVWVQVFEVPRAPGGLGFRKVELHHLHHAPRHQ